MYLTGFADEAAADIDGQIRATEELGWNFIEARNIDGKNIHDIPDADFETVCKKLDQAGIRINCFGSAIANHSKSILEPFDSSLEEARRAVSRMKRLGTRLIRIMSFSILKDSPPEREEEERFRRLRILVEMFRDQGLTCVHENCMNYGGMGWRYTLRLLENVPELKLVFDTGNPVFTPDYEKPPPRPFQNSWAFYSHVREHIEYVHIKDGYRDSKNQREVYTFPGQGEAEVERIVRDLLERGYDGGFSIEPHMAVVFHDDSVKSDGEARFRNYIEYGRLMERLISQVKQTG